MMAPCGLWPRRRLVACGHDSATLVSLSTGHRHAESQSHVTVNCRLLCPLPSGRMVWLTHMRSPGPYCGSLERRSPSRLSLCPADSLCSFQLAHSSHLARPPHPHGAEIGPPRNARSARSAGRTAPGCRDYLSARAARASKQVIIALVVRAACPEPLRLTRDS